jgi:hypothetical protein
MRASGWGRGRRQRQGRPPRRARGQLRAVISVGRGCSTTAYPSLTSATSKPAVMTIDVASHFGRFRSSPLAKPRSQISGSRSRAGARSSPCAAAGSPRTPSSTTLRTRAASASVWRMRLHNGSEGCPDQRRYARSAGRSPRRSGRRPNDRLLGICRRLRMAGGASPLARTSAWPRDLRPTRDGSQGTY